MSRAQLRESIARGPYIDDRDISGCKFLLDDSIRGKNVGELSSSCDDGIATTKLVSYTWTGERKRTRIFSTPLYEIQPYRNQN